MSRYSVRLGLPGKSYDWPTIIGIINGSVNHEVAPVNSGNGFDDFNIVWAEALNAAEAGAITHFVMLHSDIGPFGQWIDTLIEEMDRLDADLVSVPAPIKDYRGLTSSGIGDPDDRWNPLRRFTVQEILSLPETFNAEEAGYPGGILLHNTGCWVADLRKPLFFETDENGECLLSFKFPMGVVRGADGKFVHQRESEDWYFSRKLYELGAKSYLTRKVKLTHRGPLDFPNFAPFGEFEHDENTRHKWDKPSLAAV
jgi:hypothetical protein